MTATARVAIYARVSTNRQEEDGTSLDSQVERCRAYADERGWQVVGVWRDTFTGAKYRERPALSSLREHVRARNVDVVLAYALDRLSRKDAHVAIVAEEADEHGARLDFVTESFEDSAVGRFIRSARAFQAEAEREKIAERTTRGKLARVNGGDLLPGGRPLYGYRWTDRVDARGKTVKRVGYAVDDEKAPVVRRVFADALAGSPIRAIARRLNADGVKTPHRAAAWSHTVVYGILKNPRYAGDAAAWAWRATGASKTIRFDAANAIALPEGTIPPLVDRATFDAVQRRLVKNKAAATRNARNPESALLRGGYAVCGYCGRNMRVVPHKTRAEAYQCCAAQSLATPCRSHSITVADLDRAVWRNVRAVLLDPGIVGRELARLRAADPTAADVGVIAKTLADVERRQRNLVARLADEDDADLAALIQTDLRALAMRKRELDADRAVVESQHARWEAAQTQLDDIARWCGTVAANVDGLDYAGRRLALDALRVQARVWGVERTPRYEIAASIPLGSAIVSEALRTQYRSRSARVALDRRGDGGVSARDETGLTTREEGAELLRLLQSAQYRDVPLADLSRMVKQRLAERARLLAQRGTSESWGSIRARIYRRDGGICQVCGHDTD